MVNQMMWQESTGDRWVRTAALAIAALTQGLSAAAQTSLTCASTGTRTHCPADTSAGVVLVRAMTAASCVLGYSWGYDADGVWVDTGCQGEFVTGQTAPQAEAVKDVDRFGEFNPYGRFLGHVAFFNDDIEAQDNASWIGLDFTTRGPVKFFAATEWGVSLMRGGQTFNAGATTQTGFPDLNDKQAGQVFGARLGYVGVDFGAGGRVALGKQWGVHTDVSLYTTEQFNVFGSQASATYTAGTDGGVTGAGRADQVVTYRNTLFRILSVGLQMQFRTAENSEAVDGFGGSAQLTVLPGVRVGAAYTKAYWPDDVQARIRGLDGDGEFAIVGGKVDWRIIEAAFTYARQKNGDLARITVDDRPVSIGFDADGVEAYLRVTGSVFSPYGGFIYYRPDDGDPILSHDFRTRYLIAGAEVHIAARTYAYAEARLFDDSVGPQGEASGFDVLTVGLNYGFSFKGFHRP